MYLLLSTESRELKEASKIRDITYSSRNSNRKKKLEDLPRDPSGRNEWTVTYKLLF